jgi:hypothetical protein
LCFAEVGRRRKPLVVSSEHQLFARSKKLKHEQSSICGGRNWDTRSFAIFTSEVHGLLRKAFQSHLNPGANLCVDEARIPCKKTSCPYLSYNKQKPAKWAMGSLNLSDSTKYLYDFTVIFVLCAKKSRS